MGAEQSSQAPWPTEVVNGTKLLYHGAPGQVAASIMTNGLKPSRGGRLGAGIYLTDNKQLAERAAKRNGHQFVVSCYVELGTMAKVPKGQLDSHGSWRNHGCDSCTGTHPAWLGIPPFTEYVVADPSRVIIFKVEGFVASWRNLHAPKPVVRFPSRKPNAPQPQQMGRGGPAQQTFAATLASHGGQAIVPRCVCCLPCAVCIHPLIICPCCCTDLGLGPASNAQRLTWDAGGHLYLENSCGQHLNPHDQVVDAEVGGWCCGCCPANEEGVFRYNESNGTILYRDLALGVRDDGKLILVSQWDFLRRLKFTGANGGGGGGGCLLM